MPLKFGKLENQCSGCRICEIACALQNKRQCNPKKAFIKIDGNFPKPGGYKIKILKGCTLCGECIRCCPTGALFDKTAEVKGVQQ